MPDITDTEGALDPVVEDIALDQLEYCVIGPGEVDAARLPVGRAVELVVPFTVGLQGDPS
ncbi:Uncharacterised protein [Mycobacteroides abscessus]|nr:Uncharacterised protein [Mycobacteroides abscessus]